VVHLDYAVAGELGAAVDAKDAHGGSVTLGLVDVGWRRRFEVLGSR
jgi:hypothetical protein